jgi:hypothetical protein
MKRSEAIALIHSIVYNDPFNDDIAIIILDKLEQAGMLPPENTRSKNTMIFDLEHVPYAHSWDEDDYFFEEKE